MAILAFPLLGNTFLTNLGLSVGLYARVAVGLGLLMGYTAIAAEPELLLDEPAAGLNRVETAHLPEVVRQLVRQHGITVLLVEHDMGLVMSLANWIVVLDYGKKIAAGLPADVRANPRVIEACLGVVDEELWASATEGAPT